MVDVTGLRSIAGTASFIAALTAAAKADDPASSGRLARLLSLVDPIARLARIAGTASFIAALTAAAKADDPASSARLARLLSLVDPIARLGGIAGTASFIAALTAAAAADDAARLVRLFSCFDAVMGFKSCRGAAEHINALTTAAIHDDVELQQLLSEASDKCGGQTRSDGHTTWSAAEDKQIWDNMNAAPDKQLTSSNLAKQMPGRTAIMLRCRLFRLKNMDKAASSTSSSLPPLQEVEWSDAEEDKLASIVNDTTRRLRISAVSLQFPGRDEEYLRVKVKKIRDAQKKAGRRLPQSKSEKRQRLQ